MMKKFISLLAVAGAIATALPGYAQHEHHAEHARDPTKHEMPQMTGQEAVYAGYPGEPALGPSAFMHRMSAFNNPDAVFGHHFGRMQRI